MASAILRRSPAGKFISRPEAMRTWLPAMLRACWCDPLGEMLNVGALWCEREGSRELKLGALCLEAQTSPSSVNIAGYIQRYEKWLKRRDVLLEAYRRLGELR